MRRLLLWSCVAGFMGCLLKPTLATITPDYSYVDGCQAVIVQGHDLGTDAKAKIGSADFLDLQAAQQDPSVPDWAQDVGFKYTGTVPPAPDGPGFYDVVLTVDGTDLTIHDGFYYRACPGAIVVDAYDVPTDATVGSTLSFQGCNLTADTNVDFVDEATGTVVAQAPMQSDCSSAYTHAVVPTLAAGTYDLQLSNGNGDLYPLQVCPLESGAYVYGHTGGIICDPITVTIPAR